MHRRRVSRAAWLELAQFIKPGPVHRPEFTRWRHLQQTAATHSWWEGQADVQGQSKGEAGESLRSSVCQGLNELPLHPLLKDRVQLVRLKALSWPGSLSLSLSFSSSAYPSPRRLSISTASSAPQYECTSGWVASLALPKATRAKRASTKMKVELHTQTQYDCPHWAQENGTFVKLSPDHWDIHLVLLQVASCSLFIYSINYGW